MLYSIVGIDNANSLEARMAVRNEHVARLKDLLDQGRLIIAGPNPAIDSEDPGDAGFSGSIIIAEFDSLKAAEDWAADDPYIKSGAYASTMVKPFRKVLP
ncbi:MAG TPA: YciI family protein [Gammaproteobacteria bacterium]|nr:YciI family protein [Gammaproteobacteria bacterium]